MTNPKTGWMTREWEVEIITSNIHAAGGLGLYSSAKHPTVSEAYPLAWSGQGTVPVNPSVIAHDVSFPNVGTVGATQVATLGPQQFLVSGVPVGTITTGLFLIRGR
jgi:hypothetical protein